MIKPLIAILATIPEAISASPAANGWNDGFGSDGGGDPVLILYLYLLGLATAVAWKIYLGKDGEVRWTTVPLWGVGWSFIWVMVFQLLALFGLPFLVIYELAFR